MTKFSKFAGKPAAPVTKHKDAVTNFMAGTSYKLNPLDTLRIVAASSIFSEPSYYRASGVSSVPGKKTPALRAGKTVGDVIANMATLREYSILAGMYASDNTTTSVFTKAIDAALAYDFQGTLELAVELRRDFYMRLNPSVIFIRASIHPGRIAFNEANPGYMREAGKLISFRPDDLTNQFEYYMYINGGKKNGLSSLVKRTWADKLTGFSRYQLNKYKGKRLIDLVRISHAWSNDIDELMKTGTLVMPDEDQTWETLKSAGKNWKQIIATIKMPHMALLRNLRGIFTEVNDNTFAKEILGQLKEGVLDGKQFPFRYWSAYQAVESASLNHKSMILDALEECLDISIANMPTLPGKVACLTDNSGSAWTAMTSEYGSTQVAEIDNLSSLITAMNSEEGHVGVFGDRLQMVPVSKRNGLLSQLKSMNAIGKGIGHGTEHGIWLFWDKAIKNKEHWDTVFIYSDQQAGHGMLYGTGIPAQWQHKNARGGTQYVDVLKMIEFYRQNVNPKVNVISVQTAGYNNNVIPENLYRGALLAGWTGKESFYAKALMDIWDEVESVKARKVKPVKVQLASTYGQINTPTGKLNVPTSKKRIPKSEKTVADILKEKK